jgi:peptidoglycan/LPS O-acetylase OafA/YrhL
MHNVSQPPTNADRMAAIDALRGIGALTVCALHARELMWIGLSAASARRASDLDPVWLLNVATYPASLGSLGVALFFVLSGYCIHRPQARGPRTVDTTRYLLRRAWRIYPVLAASLVLTMLLDQATNALAPESLRTGDSSWLTLVGNLLGLQGSFVMYFGSNGPLWSLSLEMQLYVVYLAMLPALRHLGAWPVLAACALISVASQACVILYAPSFVFFAPYLFTWCLGVFVAECEVGAARLPATDAVTTTVLIVAGMALVAIKWPYASWLVGGSGFALLTYRCVSMGAFSTPPRWLGSIGIISYSLYATHEPVIFFLRALWLEGAQSDNQLWAFAGMGVCIVVGYALYFTVERWSLKLPAALRRLGATTPRASTTR